MENPHRLSVENLGLHRVTPSPLAVREAQIETAVGQPTAPARIAELEKTDCPSSQRGPEPAGTFLPCWSWWRHGCTLENSAPLPSRANRTLRPSATPGGRSRVCPERSHYRPTEGLRDRPAALGVAAPNGNQPVCPPRGQRVEVSHSLE